MFYVLLIISLLVCMVISYKLFKDFFSISFVGSTVYFVSTLIAFLSRIFKTWNFIDIKMNVFLIIFLGIIALITGEYVITRFSLKQKNRMKLKLSEVHFYSIYTQILMLLFVIATLCLVYFKMASATGIYYNISSLISTYHNGTALYNNSGDVMTIGTFATQFYRISVVICFMSIYFVCCSFFRKKSIKNYIIYLMIIFIVSIISILYAGRSTIIAFAFAVLFDSLYINNMRTFSSLNKDTLKKIVISIAAVLCVFYFMMPIIGRTQTTSFKNYISFYAGSPVPSLQYAVDNSLVPKSTHFGENSFTGIQRILYKAHIIDYYSAYENVWINYNSGLYNNVLTGMADYYFDFGLFGVIILEFFTGFIFGLIYKKTKIKNNFFYIVFYSMLVFSLFNQFRTNITFGTLFSIDTILSIAYMYIIYIIINIFEKYRRDSLHEK